MILLNEQHKIQNNAVSRDFSRNNAHAIVLI